MSSPTEDIEKGKTYDGLNLHQYDEETGKVFCVWDVFVLRPMDKRSPAIQP